MEEDVRLHDPNGSRLWIPDAKTETGIRHVEITPSLRDELLAYRAEKASRGYPTDPRAPLFCTRKGASWNEDNVRKDLLAPAALLASQCLVERGLPPLPHITPHSLRRTYVSIMLLATEFDIPFVQHQVGHAHARMTIDVYNQLLGALGETIGGLDPLYPCEIEGSAAARVDPIPQDQATPTPKAANSEVHMPPNGGAA